MRKGRLNIDISNKNLKFFFELNGTPVYITESMFATWIVSAALIIFAVIVRIKLKNFKDVPSGFQNVIEVIVETLVNLTKSALGEKYSILGAWFFTVFIFIITSNYSGLTGVLRPPTSDLATTASLGITTFFMIHIVGIKEQKGAYFKEYLDPFPLFLPINLVGIFATPLSLSFRLFGNIFGGLLIMELFYTMTPVFIRVGVPSLLHIYFDVFSGALQAFVFTFLSLTFIQLKLKTAAD